MSSILKVRIPFFRRVGGDNASSVVFYLAEQPERLPQVNQRVIITHTQVANNSGLDRKLKAVSTNTLLGRFVSFITDETQELLQVTDGFTRAFVLQYDDTTFATTQGAGDSQGYIEYDVNPTDLSVLKPIESAVIVNESVPFDLNDGLLTITNRIDATYPDNYLRGMFVKRNDTNTIFANLLQSLNLPVSEFELKKYTRSPLGRLIETTLDSEIVTRIAGVGYRWEQFTSTGVTNETLVVHPTTGWTGEYYSTVLQTIGSYEFTPDNKSATPISNDLYLIFEIPNNSYGEIIDGKSVRFTLPYFAGSGGTVVQQKLGIYPTYSATPTQLNLYGTYNKKNLTQTNLDRTLSEIDYSMKDLGIRPDLSTNVYESNVVLLFSDTIKRPNGDINKTWGSGYSDLIDGTRVFNPTVVKKELYDYKQDECVGFVSLDKGFIVITHPKIVDSYFTQIFGGEITSAGTNLNNSVKNYNINNVASSNTTKTGPKGSVKVNATKMIVTTNESNNIVWDSTQFVLNTITNEPSAPNEITSEATYLSYNTEKSLNIVCLASSNEFFKTTNDTAKELLGLQENIEFANFKSENQDLYPVIITQLGIHDEAGNLLAICKPTQPVKKYWYDVVSFNVKIRL